MPVDQQPHGIGSIINKINKEYQTEYNTTENIIEFGQEDATIEVVNSTVSGGYGPPRSYYRQITSSSLNNISAGIFSLGGTGYGAFGNKFYGISENLQEWDLSTLYDLSTNSLSSEWSTPQTNGSIQDVWVDRTGAEGWFAQNERTIRHFTMGTDWDFTTASFGSNDFELPSDWNGAEAVACVHNGNNPVTLFALAYGPDDRFAQISSESGAFALANVDTTISLPTETIESVSFYGRCRSDKNWAFFTDGGNASVYVYRTPDMKDITTWEWVDTMKIFPDSTASNTKWLDLSIPAHGKICYFWHPDTYDFYHAERHLQA